MIPFICMCIHTIHCLRLNFIYEFIPSIKNLKEYTLDRHGFSNMRREVNIYTFIFMWILIKLLYLQLKINLFLETHFVFTVIHSFIPLKHSRYIYILYISHFLRKQNPKRNHAHCYRVNFIPPKKICCSPNPEPPQTPRMWLYCEMGSLHT